MNTFDYLRRRYDLTVRDVAEKTKIDRSALSRFSQGVMLNEDKIIAIADFFAVDRQYLLTGHGYITARVATIEFKNIPDWFFDKADSLGEVFEMVGYTKVAREITGKSAEAWLALNSIHELSIEELAVLGKHLKK